MRFSPRALLFFGIALAGCQSRTSTLALELVSAAPMPEQLFLSVFDDAGPRIFQRELPRVPQSGGTIVLLFDDDVRDLRIAVAAKDGAAPLGATRVTLAPKHRRSATLVVSSDEPDLDHDGIADSIDNCPDLVNPSQDDLCSALMSPPPPSPIASPSPSPNPSPSPSPSPIVPARLFGGRDFACAADSDGRVGCWGANQHGELGLGHTLDALAPAISAYSNVEQLVGGAGFSCARSADGFARCFGSDAYGKLGNGALAGDQVLSSTSLLLGNIVELRAGMHHACARTFDGHIWCWGKNDLNAVGTGSLIDQDRPIEIAGTNAIATTTGGDVTCNLAPDGSIWCWGRNDRSQCGTDNSSPWEPASQPVSDAGQIFADEIAAGDTHLCARIADQVVCWGFNATGQLGDGTTSSRGVPAPVVTATGPLTNVASLSLGASHSCALTSDGHVYCWGDNTHGQLGVSTLSRSPVALLVPGIADVNELALGATFTCARSGTTVSCWGDNAYGQLGDGSRTPRATPAPVGF